MFVVLSKLIDVVLLPLTWSVVLVAAGLYVGLRARRAQRRRRALWVAVLGLLVLWAFSTGPVASRLMFAIEHPVQERTDPLRTYDVAIVLGGLTDDGATLTHGGPQYTESVERLLVAYDLLRTGRARRALLSGGSLAGRPDLADGVLLARQLEAWGIAPERLIIESRSRNTRENARYSAEALGPAEGLSLVLVTSAFHMQRAAGCFRKAGLEVDTLPVDFRSYDPALRRPSVFPRAERLAESTLAIREFAGRGIYRALGYSR